MRHERVGTGNSHINSPTLVLLVLLSALGALLYGSFILSPGNRGDIVPYVVVLIAESFIVTQAIFSMWTILAGSNDPRNFEYHDAQQHLFDIHGSKALFRALNHPNNYRPKNTALYLHKKPVSIDVYVTVYGEPLGTIAETVTAARNIVGKHQTYILDDGKSDQVKELAKELNVGYIRRPGNKGAKAGNINYALSKTTGKFFAVIDADFVARPHFLYEMLPFFEDERVAFVQSPQAYANDGNTISKGAGYMQRLFYRLIQPGKNRFNAAFCVGTNVVFRRKAIESIGGIYQKSKSEDIWTSILLHEGGWRSVFIPDILAMGQTPDTIKAYSKQQLRWATGGFQILLRHNPLTKKLTIDQKLQYLHTTTYYLHGFAVLMLLSLPVMHIFFNWSPVNLSIPLTSWLGYYLAFYGMQVVLAFYTMEGFKLQTLVLAMVSSPIYIRAFFNALLGREEAWDATGNKAGRNDSPFNYILPQLMLCLFLAFTSAVGCWKAYYYRSASLSLFWSILNTIIFGSFMVIAWREQRRIKPSATRFTSKPIKRKIHVIPAKEVI
jgi:cellulose synthase (UDP-forming)